MLLALGAVVYFFPTVVALFRGVRWDGVFVVNLLLGWSVLGWIVALVMACSLSPRPGRPRPRWISGRLRDIPAHRRPY